ncbi:TPR-like protein, partial [Metschnikowia bicuspidata var. bicuspidata NRRL YB-4993]
MEEPLDISYYLGAGAPESLKTVEIVIGSGDIVTIDELPEDALELETFLQAESCAVKYWILVLQAYSQAGQAADGAAIAETGLLMDYMSLEDRVLLHFTIAWTRLALAAEGVEKAKNIELANEHLAQTGDSTTTNALLAQAQVHLLTDRADIALQLFDRLLKQDPNNCYGLLGKAQITLSKTQNYTNALKLYQQVLVSNPAMKPDPRLGIGICYWFLKERELALSAWERVLELDPSNFKAKLLLNLASFDEVFTNSLSDDLFLQGYSKSLKQLSSLHLEKPLDPVILLSLCSYYFSKGDFDLVEKIIAKVVSSLNENVITSLAGSKLSPFTSKLLSSCSFWLGRVAYSRGDFTQSQKNFHEAIRLNENNLLAKLGVGQSQLSRNLTEEAIITFESILKTNSKCLEVIYSLGILYSQSPSRTKQEQAIQLLERYIRLSNNRGSAVANKKDAEAYLNKEPIALNAFLTLSKLYEGSDVSQSLTYLHKAVESRQQIGLDAPAEVYNNMGVFNYTKNNTEDAVKYLETALAKLEDSEIPEELREDLKIPISFNLARTQEVSDASKAVELYNKLLEECPAYFSAKLRLLFLDAVSSNASSKQEIEKEIKDLLHENASNLEIRSFYGWFIKTFGKKLGLKPDADTTHQKETLVEYDSHDSYALISLANIYCVMAKDLKNPRDEEKKKKYYIRALELFTKVLSIDPKNVFAAQGFAIVYIENKELAQGLDILRKIRDSLNDMSVYLNLGHVLTEMKQYSKAIESYEIALTRYANGQDAKILGFLGRAWYLRGLAEKNLLYLKKALEYSKEALKHATGVASPYIFNVAFIQFQIAEFISKQSVENRLTDDIVDAIADLNNAIESLNALSSEDEKHAPYPQSELKARANLGSTLLSRLNTCLDETKENVSQLNAKLEEAKKLREEEETKRAQELEAALAEEKARNEALALERIKLQEQAQQWAEEARATIAANDSDDDKMFDEESEKGKKSAKKGGKKKGKGKKKDFINDSDEDNVSEPDVESDAPSDKGEEAPTKKKTPTQKKGVKRKRRAIVDEDEEEND